MPQFRIDPAVYTHAPDLTVGLVVAKNITNPPSSPDVIARLRKAEADVRARFTTVDAVKDHPNIAAWQTVHKSFGSNPNKFPPSILALLKRVVNGKDLPSISTLVDLYNILSLEHIVPAGGEDLNACHGDIRLCLAQGNESFRTIGGTEDEPPEPGEIIYRDDDGAICRKFNWREAERTCLTNNTTNAVLVLEAVPPMTREGLESALKELYTLVLAHCGGEATIQLLDRTQSSGTL